MRRNICNTVAGLVMLIALSPVFVNLMDAVSGVLNIEPVFGGVTWGRAFMSLIWFSVLSFVAGIIYGAAND